MQPQSQGGRLEVGRGGAGADQPRVAAAEADQPLVGPVVAPAVGREAGRSGGERGPDLVVAAFAVLLEATESLLVAVVDAWHAADAEQDGEREREVTFVVEDRG